MHSLKNRGENTDNIYLSKARIMELAKLKQKKYRLEAGKVVIEGSRLINQLASWGIKPLELYGDEPLPELQDVNTHALRPGDMAKICSSEHPPGIAGLYPLPRPHKVAYEIAFYLEDISDPGNLGTIFRIASAFGIGSLLLSPNCCEVSSPKVIRASLGAVYRVPFQVGVLDDMLAPENRLAALVMGGETALHEFIPQSFPWVLAIGSEAHGLSPHTIDKANSTLRIEMSGGMESLNAAVCAGIAAYHLANLVK